MTNPLEVNALRAAGEAAARADSQAARDIFGWQNYFSGGSTPSTGGYTPFRDYADSSPSRRRRSKRDRRPSTRSTAASTSVRASVSRSERKSAYTQYVDMLTRYGFDRSNVLSFLKGLNYSTLRDPLLVTEAFRKTGMWEDRFGAVMRGRDGNGYSYMNEGDIIRMEDSYRQIFTAAGIPERFWDRNDLQDLIINDVSTAEVQERVNLAEYAVNNTDPSWRKAFRQWYGVGKKELIGYMLNREKGTERLQQEIEAAAIGSEAISTGMDKVGRKFAEKLVDKDISRQEARQAFATVASEEKDWRRLAKLSGEKISERGLIKDELGLDKNDRVGKKKKRLASQERARFSNSGAGSGGQASPTIGEF